MSKTTITVAGEPLEDLEAALDCFDIEMDRDGRVTMTGALPPYLGIVLERALATIEAEITTSHPGVSLDDGEMYPMQQLFLRIGAAYAEHG